eukprot:3788461-Prymnesium_polylepis.1
MSGSRSLEASGRRPLRSIESSGRSVEGAYGIERRGHSHNVRARCPPLCTATAVRQHGYLKPSAPALTPVQGGG